MAIIFTYSFVFDPVQFIGRFLGPRPVTPLTLVLGVQNKKVSWTIERWWEGYREGFGHVSPGILSCFLENLGHKQSLLGSSPVFLPGLRLYECPMTPYLLFPDTPFQNKTTTKNLPPSLCRLPLWETDIRVGWVRTVTDPRFLPDVDVGKKVLV